MENQTITERIANLLETAHKNGAFDGVALVARGNEVLHRGAYGMANRENHTAHSLQTPFPICSVTKQFTALLVMQQVADGRLRVDGTLADYLPDAQISDGAKRITLRNLLMHTSGLPNLDDVPGFYENVNPRLTDPAYVLQTYCAGVGTFAPGSQFRYNNADYLALSAILEKVSGLPYAELLQARILGPLKMRRTSLVSARNPRRIAGYEKGTTGPVPEQPVYRLENFGAAGAMQSTVDDLLVWDRALDTDRLLPARWREIMFTSDPAKGYTAFGTWVYGYQKYGAKTPTLYERQGGIGALKAQNLRVPEDRISIILLSNLDTADLAAYTGNTLTCDLLRAIYEP